MTVNDYLSALGWTPDKAAQKAQERPIPKFQRKNTPKPDPEAEHLYDLASRNLKANLNVKESLQWMQQAADMGHCLACHQMALLLEDGKLVKKDRDAAIAYARKSAQMDYFQAQQYLGELLQKEGRYEEAAEWLRKAAEQGVGQAAVLLAQLYENGQGVPLDRVEAAFWYKVALKDFFFLNRDAAQQSLQRLEGADGYLEQIAQKPVNDFLGVEKLYEKGFAKLIDMPVNWCEELGTVLSNDEVPGLRFCSQKSFAAKTPNLTASTMRNSPLSASMRPFRFWKSWQRKEISGL